MNENDISFCESFHQNKTYFFLFLSSAMSAAKAATDHMRTLWHGTHHGEWVSMAVFSDGKHYGAPQGVMFSFPGEYPVFVDQQINFSTLSPWLLCSGSSLM
jgi:hypothetical protein